MERTYKTILSVVCLLLIVVTLAVFGGCWWRFSFTTNEHTYSVWLYTGQDISYYSDYAENPVLTYLIDSGEWNNGLSSQVVNEIAFEFQVPATGQAQSQYQTMIQSGDFPTLMQSSVADPAPVMYDSGYILDITEYVKQYMPNYYNLIQTNPQLKAATTFEIDGEERILSINVLNESKPYVDFGGMCYRRDLIVKYGTPCEGQIAEGVTAFSGGYTDQSNPDSWQDNVKFPSWYKSDMQWYKVSYPDWDGTEPITITDWEWMFDIFQKAGCTYDISMYYPGYTWAGGLCSCFGEGGIVWYADSQTSDEHPNGNVVFGGSSESTKAYFTCMNEWYKQGWLDKSFYQRTGDLFYQIDSSSVRRGEVGMWCGVKGEFGGRISTVDGINVAGCSYPINDKYGTEECKYVVPRVMNLDTSVVGTGYYVMKGADEKDLPSMFAFLDYLYSDKGATLRTLGLDSDRLAKATQSGKEFYSKYGLDDGAYSIGSDGRYKLNNVIVNDSGSLSIAASLNKLPGLQLVKSVDYGYEPTFEKSLQSWIRYENSGRVWGSTAMLNMSVSDNKIAQDSLTKVLNYAESNAYKFITGESNLTTDWNRYVRRLNGFNVDKVSQTIQPYLDKYGI